VDLVKARVMAQVMALVMALVPAMALALALALAMAMATARVQSALAAQGPAALQPAPALLARPRVRGDVAPGPPAAAARPRCGQPGWQGDQAAPPQGRPPAPNSA
jgi:hypothetical protein